MSPAESGRLFFELNPQPIFVFDTDTLEILDVNPAAVKQYGYSREELLRLTVLDIRPPEDREVFLKKLANDIAKPVINAESRHMTKDGRRFYVEVVGSDFEQNGRKLRMTVISDVTEKVETMRRLAMSESRVQEIFDCLPDAVFEFRESGQIVSVNRRTTQITGLSREELLQRRIWDLLPVHSRNQASRVWPQSADREIELEMLARYGEPVALQFRCSRHIDAYGNVLYVGVGRDARERRQAEKYAVHRRKLLEMMSGGADFDESISLIRNIVEESVSGGSCFIVLPQMNGLETSAGSSTTLRAHFQRLLSASSLRIQAINVKTGIQMHEIDPPDDGPPTGPRYIWSLSIGDPREDGGRIVVALKESRAPEPLEVAALQHAADMLGMAVEHQRRTFELRQKARFDILTGLPNRLVFGEQLNLAIQRASGGESTVTVVFVDLDDFKLFNDSAGHIFGDRILEKIARRMRDWISPPALLARMGGDEFTILLETARTETDSEKTVGRIMELFEHPFRIDESEFFVKASAGVGRFPNDGETASQLMRAADSALYHAKANCRGKWKFYSSDMGETASTRLSVLTQLHRATGKGELTLAYQPQISMDTGEVIAVEALLRWNSPILGSVPPGTFIPIAEQSGLIVEIGNWVLATACRQERLWLNALGPACPRISVNISALQFRQANFIDLVMGSIESAGITPDRLELELTESILMHDVSQAQVTIGELRNLGIRIALDDFGTGYSSLSYLERLEVDMLKLDASFVRRISPHTAIPPMVEGIIGLAHSMDIEIIAEGVETNYQLDYLRSLGCDLVQGFLFSKAVPADEIPALLGKKLAPRPYIPDTVDRAFRKGELRVA